MMEIQAKRSETFIRGRVYEYNASPLILNDMKYSNKFCYKKTISLKGGRSYSMPKTHSLFRNKTQIKLNE